MRATGSSLIWYAWALAVATIVAVTACAPLGSTAPDRGAANGGPPTPAAPKSITLVFAVERPAALAKLNAGLRGNQRWWWIVNAYLTGLDHTGAPQPMLAEEVPSLDRGTWRVNPDGTSETLYRVRPAARWHDGNPVLAKDFLFAWEVYLDPEFPTADRTVEKLIANIATADDRTLVIRWKEPYVGADAIGAPSLEPLPTHLLAELYRADKQAFVDGRHWTSEFVGAGPFRVEEWVSGSGQIIVGAHDGYALGRPQIDRIFIRFTEDRNAVLAGVLAGTIDVALGDTIDTQGAVILREQWESQGAGTVGITQGTQRYLTFQLRDLPHTQPAVRSKPVRKALAHAIDREAMANMQPPGFLVVAHYPIALDDRFYSAVGRSVPKSAYDPALAGRLLSDAGYRSGPDSVRRDASGDRLDVPILTSAGHESETIATVILDNWRAVGVEGEMSVIPATRARDREYQSTFRGATHKSWITRFDQLLWVSDQIPSGGNRWAGSNWGGYSTPETDDLARRVLTTLDVPQRERVVVELMRIWSDDVAAVPFLYNTEYIVAARGLGAFDVAVSPAQGAHTWSIHRWTKQ